MIFSNSTIAINVILAYISAEILNYITYMEPTTDDPKKMVRDDFHRMFLIYLNILLFVSIFINVGYLPQSVYIYLISLFFIILLLCIIKYLFYKESSLDRINWFKQRKLTHYQNIKDRSKNIGVTSSFMDRLFNTYIEPEDSGDGRPERILRHASRD